MKITDITLIISGAVVVIGYTFYPNLLGFPILLGILLGVIYGVLSLVPSPEIKEMNKESAQILAENSILERKIKEKEAECQKRYKELVTALSEIKKLNERIKKFEDYGLI
jgi:hypothetical protein